MALRVGPTTQWNWQGNTETDLAMATRYTTELPVEKGCSIRPILKNLPRFE